MAEDRPQMPHEQFPVDANTEAIVERRAREIAETEGRSTPNEADRSEALREIREEEPPPANDLPSGTVPTAEAQSTRDPTEPADTGRAHPDAPPEDENERISDHVEKGLEEADHEHRLSAREEDDPERSS